MYNKEIIIDTNKGQKISAALYLVTSHLSDTDPYKLNLRQKGVELLIDSTYTLSEAGQSIINLLGSAVLAQLISEKNASIIILEIKHFLLLPMHDDSMTTLFSSMDVIKKDTTKKTTPSLSFNTYKTNAMISPERSHRNVKEINDNKHKRQDAIVSFINDRKSGGIKDISLLFPDISEKTIQRELGVLVQAGKITKRGSKRWSVYMAVN